MTADSTGTVYTVTAPSDNTNVIFCRMSPQNTANNWNNVWNQTDDLTIADGQGKQYVIDGWNKSGHRSDLPVPETVPSTTEPEVFQNAIRVFVGAALQDAGASYAFAWTWNEGENGTWRPIEKYAYLAARENVLFAFFNTDTPAWGSQVAQTVDFKVNNGDELTLTTEKNEEGYYLGYWASEQPTTEEPATEEPTTEEPATKEPATEEPATEEPTTEEPTAAEPTTEEPAAVDYYLFGYINGANYACEGDAANMGEYKFEDGTLFACFEQDSYVAVKTTGNANWYMTKGWLGTDVTEATLYNTTILGNDANKLFVPGGRGVTFTLTVCEDDTLKLSYVADTEPSTVEPETEEPSEQPTTEVITEEPTTEEPTTEEPTTEEPVAVDYYLFGYINGANYACEEDAANMGEYKFEDGTLTAQFEQDSYVAVKTTGNANWYMTKGWLGTDVTEATLYNTTTLGNDANKLFVPGGRGVTFTLTVCEDDTLKLSYVADTEPSTVEPETEEPSEQPTTEVITEEPTTEEPTTEEPAAVDYYLFGYINGANYACEGDAANMGEYKFEDGTLTAQFEQDSYVAVKTTDNANWYMTKGWLGTDVTEATLYNTNTLGATANKLFVPGGVEVKFTLTVLDNDTLKLSYVADTQPTTEEPTTEEPTSEEPTTEEPTTEEPTTEEPVAVDYYLFGYINGANYACEGDAANMGEYKFVDGALTAKFEQDSYVAVKTTGNANWYMTKGWLGTDVTEATLYNTSTLGNDANKLFVPGGVEVTFTLTAGYEKDTLVLSYSQNSTGFPLGDLNEDGVVTIQDATLLQRYLAEFETLTPEQLKRADVTKDGKVNINDVTEIQRFAAEYITSF